MKFICLLFFKERGLKIKLNIQIYSLLRNLYLLITFTANNFNADGKASKHLHHLCRIFKVIIFKSHDSKSSMNALCKIFRYNFAFSTLLQTVRDHVDDKSLSEQLQDWRETKTSIMNIVIYFITEKSNTTFHILQRILMGTR